MSAAPTLEVEHAFFAAGAPVVIGVDEFDDEVDTVRLDDLGPHERARIAARLRQVLAQLGDDRPQRLH